MNTFWTKVTTFLKNNWVTIIFGIVIIVLVLLMMQQCQKSRDQQAISDHNIAALKDSVSYYKGKNGKLVAEKAILYGDKETLKLAYDSLYKKLQSMNVKDPTTAVNIDVNVDNGHQDTAWVIEHDSCCLAEDTTIRKDFNFDNQWRELNGYVALSNDSLNLNIEKDVVNADITLAIKDGKAYVSSDNPFLNVTNIEGITVPEYKPMWSLTVGPSASLGYDPWHNTFSPTVGVSLVIGYTIWSGGKKAAVKK
jgi:hypothetical protein